MSTYILSILLKVCKKEGQRTIVRESDGQDHPSCLFYWLMQPECYPNAT